MYNITPHPATSALFDKMIRYKQPTKQALFGKESCQRQPTERLINILLIYDIRLKIRLSYQGQSLRFFLRKTTSLYTRAAVSVIFGCVYLQPKFDVNNPNCKALFGKESCQRQLTERLKTFCLQIYSLLCKNSMHTPPTNTHMA